MGKRLSIAAISIFVILGLTSCAGQKDSGVSGYRIGFAVQTLSNQVWAQQAEELKTVAQRDGNQVTVVDCNGNALRQIDQLENFIIRKVDAIIVNPVAGAAVESVCREARESGILVLSYDEEMENSDINWLIDNYDLGIKIGQEAAQWVNQTFGDAPCEAVILGYPQTPILYQREQGIKESLSNLSPNADIVANQSALDTTEGLNAMETILQAHPGVKVVCCIGGGGATGSNEALKGFYGTDNYPEDVAVFSTDLTDETIESMQNGEFDKVCVAITGNAVSCADAVYDLVIRKLNGEEMEQNIYREFIPVNADNLHQILDQ